MAYATRYFFHHLRLPGFAGHQDGLRTPYGYFVGGAQKPQGEDHQKQKRYSNVDEHGGPFGERQRSAMPDTGHSLEDGDFPGIGSGVLCVPDMRVNQEMKVLDARIQNPSIRRRQLRRREASWERSCGQNCEPTNRNVQRGRRRGRAGTTQRSPGFTAAGKARGCAAKVHSLTRGDLRSDLAGDRKGPPAATPVARRRSQQRS